ncbi:MAG TPA: class II aldolase/adducin family protein [Sphaerochaeta sp.]|nr:class II aldolase/adducin family protein [Sphaerochaeta sp.]
MSLKLENPQSCLPPVTIHILACTQWCICMLPIPPFAPFIPYFVMQVGEVGVLPYRTPGSELLAKDIEQRPQFTTYLMANHGLLVCGSSLSQAVFAAQEFAPTVS